MDFFLKFLILGGKYLTQITAQSIIEAYKRSMRLRQTLSSKFEKSFRMTGRYENILEMYNDNLDEISRNTQMQMAFISDAHRKEFEAYLKEIEEEEGNLRQLQRAADGKMLERRSNVVEEQFSKIEEDIKNDSLLMQQKRERSKTPIFNIPRKTSSFMIPTNAIPSKSADLEEIKPREAKAKILHREWVSRKDGFKLKGNDSEKFKMKIQDDIETSKVQKIPIERKIESLTLQEEMLVPEEMSKMAKSSLEMEEYLNLQLELRNLQEDTLNTDELHKTLFVEDEATILQDEGFKEEESKFDYNLLKPVVSVNSFEDNESEKLKLLKEPNEVQENNIEKTPRELLKLLKAKESNKLPNKMSIQLRESKKNHYKQLKNTVKMKDLHERISRSKETHNIQERTKKERFKEPNDLQQVNIRSNARCDLQEIFNNSEESYDVQSKGDEIEINSEESIRLEEKVLSEYNTQDFTSTLNESIWLYDQMLMSNSQDATIKTDENTTVKSREPTKLEETPGKLLERIRKQERAAHMEKMLKRKDVKDLALASAKGVRSGGNTVRMDVVGSERSIKPEGDSDFKFTVTLSKKSEESGDAKRHEIVLNDIHSWEFPEMLLKKKKELDAKRSILKQLKPKFKPNKATSEDTVKPPSLIKMIYMKHKKVNEKTVKEMAKISTILSEDSNDIPCSVFDRCLSPEPKGLVTPTPINDQVFADSAVVEAKAKKLIEKVNVKRKPETKTKRPVIILTPDKNYWNLQEWAKKKENTIKIFEEMKDEMLHKERLLLENKKHFSKLEARMCKEKEKPSTYRNEWPRLPLSDEAIRDQFEHNPEVPFLRNRLSGNWNRFGYSAMCNRKRKVEYIEHNVFGRKKEELLTRVRKNMLEAEKTASWLMKNMEEFFAFESRLQAAEFDKKLLMLDNSGRDLTKASEVFAEFEESLWRKDVSERMEEVRMEGRRLNKNLEAFEELETILDSRVMDYENEEFKGKSCELFDQFNVKDKEIEMSLQSEVEFNGLEIFLNPKLVEDVKIKKSRVVDDFLDIGDARMLEENQRAFSELEIILNYKLLQDKMKGLDDVLPTGCMKLYEEQGFCENPELFEIEAFDEDVMKVLEIVEEMSNEMDDLDIDSLRKVKDYISWKQENIGRYQELYDMVKEPPVDAVKAMMIKDEVKAIGALMEVNDIECKKLLRHITHKLLNLEMKSPRRSKTKDMHPLYLEPKFKINEEELKEQADLIEANKRAFIEMEENLRVVKIIDNKAMKKVDQAHVPMLRDQIININIPKSPRGAGKDASRKYTTDMKINPTNLPSCYVKQTNSLLQLDPEANCKVSEELEEKISLDLDKILRSIQEDKCTVDANQVFSRNFPMTKGKSGLMLYANKEESALMRLSEPTKQESRPEISESLGYVMAVASSTTAQRNMFVQQIPEQEEAYKRPTRKHGFLSKVSSAARSKSPLTSSHDLLRLSKLTSELMPSQKKINLKTPSSRDNVSNQGVRNYSQKPTTEPERNVRDLEESEKFVGEEMADHIMYAKFLNQSISDELKSLIEDSKTEFIAIDNFKLTSVERKEEDGVDTSVQYFDSAQRSNAVRNKLEDLNLIDRKSQLVRESEVIERQSKVNVEQDVTVKFPEEIREKKVVKKRSNIPQMIKSRGYVSRGQQLEHSVKLDLSEIIGSQNADGNISHAKESRMKESQSEMKMQKTKEEPRKSFSEYVCVSNQKKPEVVTTVSNNSSKTETILLHMKDLTSNQSSKTSNDFLKTVKKTSTKVDVNDSSKSQSVTQIISQSKHHVRNTKSYSDTKQLKVGSSRKTSNHEIYPWRTKKDQDNVKKNSKLGSAKTFTQIDDDNEVPKVIQTSITNTSKDKNEKNETNSNEVILKTEPPKGGMEKEAENKADILEINSYRMEENLTPEVNSYQNEETENSQKLKINSNQMEAPDAVFEEMENSNQKEVPVTVLETTEKFRKQEMNSNQKEVPVTASEKTEKSRKLETNSNQIDVPILVLDKTRFQELEMNSNQKDIPATVTEQAEKPGKLEMNSNQKKVTAKASEKMEKSGKLEMSSNQKELPITVSEKTLKPRTSNQKEFGARSLEMNSYQKEIKVTVSERKLKKPEMNPEILIKALGELSPAKSLWNMVGIAVEEKGKELERKLNSKAKNEKLLSQQGKNSEIAEADGKHYDIVNLEDDSTEALKERNNKADSPQPNFPKDTETTEHIPIEISSNQQIAHPQCGLNESPNKVTSSPKIHSINTSEANVDFNDQPISSAKIYEEHSNPPKNKKHIPANNKQTNFDSSATILQMKEDKSCHKLSKGKKPKSVEHRSMLLNKQTITPFNITFEEIQANPLGEKGVKQETSKKQDEDDRNSFEDSKKMKRADELKALQEEIDRMNTTTEKRIEKALQEERDETRTSLTSKKEVEVNSSSVDEGIKLKDAQKEDENKKMQLRKERNSCIESEKVTQKENETQKIQPSSDDKVTNFKINEIVLENEDYLQISYEDSTKNRILKLYQSATNSKENTSAEFSSPINLKFIKVPDYPVEESKSKNLVSRMFEKFKASDSASPEDNAKVLVSKLCQNTAIFSNEMSKSKTSSKEDFDEFASSNENKVEVQAAVENKEMEQMIEHTATSPDEEKSIECTETPDEEKATNKKVECNATSVAEKEKTIKTPDEVKEVKERKIETVTSTLKEKKVEVPKISESNFASPPPGKRNATYVSNEENIEPIVKYPGKKETKENKIETVASTLKEKKVEGPKISEIKFASPPLEKQNATSVSNEEKIEPIVKYPGKKEVKEQKIESVASALKEKKVEGPKIAEINIASSPLGKQSATSVSNEEKIEPIVKYPGKKEVKEKKIETVTSALKEKKVESPKISEINFAPPQKLESTPLKESEVSSTFEERVKLPEGKQEDEERFEDLEENQTKMKSKFAIPSPPSVVEKMGISKTFPVKKTIEKEINKMESVKVGNTAISATSCAENCNKFETTLSGVKKVKSEEVAKVQSYKEFIEAFSIENQAKVRESVIEKKLEYVAAKKKREIPVVSSLEVEEIKVSDLQFKEENETTKKHEVQESLKKLSFTSNEEKIKLPRISSTLKFAEISSEDSGTLSSNLKKEERASIETKLNDLVTLISPNERKVQIVAKNIEFTKEDQLAKIEKIRFSNKKNAEMTSPWKNTLSFEDRQQKQNILQSKLQLQKNANHESEISKSRPHVPNEVVAKNVEAEMFENYEREAKIARKIEWYDKLLDEDKPSHEIQTAEEEGKKKKEHLGLKTQWYEKLVDGLKSEEGDAKRSIKKTATSVKQDEDKPSHEIQTAEEEGKPKKEYLGLKAQWYEKLVDGCKSEEGDAKRSIQNTATNVKQKVPQKENKKSGSISPREFEELSQTIEKAESKRNVIQQRGKMFEETKQDYKEDRSETRRVSEDDEKEKINAEAKLIVEKHNHNIKMQENDTAEYSCTPDVTSVLAKHRDYIEKVKSSLKIMDTQTPELQESPEQFSDVEEFIQVTNTELEGAKVITYTPPVVQEEKPVVEEVEAEPLKRKAGMINNLQQGNDYSPIRIFKNSIWNWEANQNKTIGPQQLYGKEALQYTKVRKTKDVVAVKQVKKYKYERKEIKSALGKPMTVTYLVEDGGKAK